MKVSVLETSGKITVAVLKFCSSICHFLSGHEEVTLHPTIEMQSIEITHNFYLGIKNADKYQAGIVRVSLSTKEITEAII